MRIAKKCSVWAPPSLGRRRKCIYLYICRMRWIGGCGPMGRGRSPPALSLFCYNYSPLSLSPSGPTTSKCKVYRSRRCVRWSRSRFPTDFCLYYIIRSQCNTYTALARERERERDVLAPFLLSPSATAADATGEIEWEREEERKTTKRKSCTCGCSLQSSLLPFLSTSSKLLLFPPLSLRLLSPRPPVYFVCRCTACFERRKLFFNWHMIN